MRRVDNGAALSTGLAGRVIVTKLRVCSRAGFVFRNRKGPQRRLSFFFFSAFLWWLIRRRFLFTWRTVRVFFLPS